MSENSEKRCLDCNEIIVGRRDKKFCSDLCRNNYNNRINRIENNYVRNVNNILKKNRRILETIINNKEKSTISKEKLSNLGFNFNYFTHNLTTKKGSTYWFIYEYGYLFLDNDFLMIVESDKKSV